MDLYKDISYLKGVGPAKAKVLAAELGIRTYADMLDYLPFRYVDRSVISPISSLREDDSFVVVKGVLFMGKPAVFNNVWQISHPDIEPLSSVDDGARHPLMPVYHTTDKMKQHGLGTRALARITETLILAISQSDSPTIPENLPDDILRHFRLIHSPEKHGFL